MKRTSYLSVVQILLLLFLVEDGYGQTTQNLNVLFVNEESNMVADKAIDVAVSYLSKETKLGVTAEIVKVVGNRTDAQGLLDSLCTKYQEMLDNQKPPHLVLDTTMAGMASETVKSFTAALAIPTFSASFGQPGDLRQWRNIDEDEKNYLIQINPPADMIPELVRALVINQNITNAAIMFDDSFVMDHKYKSLLQNVATRHVIAPISEKEIGDQLTKFRNLDIVNYFILGSLVNIKRVLDAADNRNYFGRTYAWHALTQDEGELRCSCRNASVMYAKPISDAMYRDRLGTIKTAHQLNAKPEIAAAFYFDLALNAFLSMKELVADGGWRNVTNYITCDEYDGKNAPKRIGLDLKSYFNKERTETPTYGPITVVDNGDSYMDFEMQITAVGVREGASDKSVYLGKWRSGYSSNLTLEKPNDMRNYTADIVYRIATVVQKPFIIENPDAPKGYEGYCIDLIEKIREIVGFDYEIYAVPDGKFGNMDESGKWDGVVRDLIEKKADIGLGSMSVMAERENVIDFTVPYYDLVGITILMKLPKTPTSLFKFLTVLENQVWLCILAAYFFTSFLMWIFDRWSPYSYQNNREKYKDDEEKREFNLKECLWFCMTSLTPQGGGEAPKNLSGRLVAATWWLFGFIIIASYTANLAAFLTVSRLDTPIESLDDLSKQYKIQYAPLNGSATMTYFRRMADIENRFYEIWEAMSLNDSLSEWEKTQLAVWDYPLTTKYSKIYTSINDARPPLNMKDAIKRVKKSKSTSEGFAFIGDATDIRYLQLTDCDLQMVGEEFSRKPYALAVQQGSPLKDQFNYAIWKDMSLNDSLSEVERSKLAVWDYPVSDKYTKMWQSMQEATPPNTLEEAVKRVRKSKSSSEGFAFLGDATDVRYLQLTNCDLQMVGEEFSRKPYAIAVQQGSPLKDQFNSAILMLLNKRELERLKETWWTKNRDAKKCEKADDQSDGISIQNIGGVFIVIFVGIGLACVTLAFEYWWYKYRKNSKVIDVKEAPTTKGMGVDDHPSKPSKPSKGFNLKGSKLYPRARF